ncbi:zinc-binding dehydrogenase [Streptomyces broussonetiae]|uniref:zinc-binding dehydrogenase n=1 Tax=Streptomyces broussonetiae TaxID=2686304 RepID=UPI0035D54456
MATVRPEDILGEWKGGEFSTGHPLNGMLALATGLGAKAALPPGGGLVAALRDLTGGGAHHVVETTGRPERVRRAVGALRPRGELALLGMVDEVTLDVMGLLVKGVRVHGVVIEGDSDPGRFVPALIALHRRGRGREDGRWCGEAGAHLRLTAPIRYRDPPHTHAHTATAPTPRRAPTPSRAVID